MAKRCLLYMLRNVDGRLRPGIAQNLFDVVEAECVQGSGKQLVFAEAAPSADAAVRRMMRLLRAVDSFFAEVFEEDCCSEARVAASAFLADVALEAQKLGVKAGSC